MKYMSLPLINKILRTTFLLVMAFPWGVLTLMGVLFYCLLLPLFWMFGELRLWKAIMMDMWKILNLPETKIKEMWFVSISSVK